MNFVPLTSADCTVWACFQPHWSDWLVVPHVSDTLCSSMHVSSPEMFVGNTAICLISSTFVSVCVRGKSSRCVLVSLMSLRPHRLPFLLHGIFTVCWNSGLNPGGMHWQLRKLFTPCMMHTVVLVLLGSEEWSEHFLFVINKQTTWKQCSLCSARLTRGG